MKSSGLLYYKTIIKNKTIIKQLKNYSMSKHLSNLSPNKHYWLFEFLYIRLTAVIVGLGTTYSKDQLFTLNI